MTTIKKGRIRRRNEGKEKKRRNKERKGKKKSKKEGNYPYFVSLFNIGLMTAKNPHKQGRILKIQGGRENIFWVALIYNPVFVYL